MDRELARSIAGVYNEVRLLQIGLTTSLGPEHQATGVVRGALTDVCTALTGAGTDALTGDVAVARATLAEQGTALRATAGYVTTLAGAPRAGDLARQMTGVADLLYLISGGELTPPV